jgi:hypothetical protein
MLPDSFTPVVTNSEASGPAILSSSVRQPFNAAISRYSTRLARISAALAERQQQALRAYLESADDNARLNAKEANAKEYQELISAIQSADADRIASAQTDYLNSVRTLQDAVFAGARTALDDFLSSARSAWDEARGECKSAYRDYVRDIAAAFGSAAGDALDPATLMSVGQGIIIAAAYAAMAGQTEQTHPGEASGAVSR